MSARTGVAAIRGRRYHMPMQQPYGVPPGAHGQFAQPFPTQAPIGPVAKPVDSTRMIVAMIGFGVMALHSLTLLFIDHIESHAAAFVLAFLHAAGLVAAGVGLTGLRSTPALLSAVANAIAAVTLLGFQALNILDIESIFIYRFYFVLLDGWLAAAAVMTAVTLFVNARKLGPAAFAAGGLWAIASLIEARFLFVAVAHFLKQEVGYSEGWRTASLVGILLASIAAAVTFLLFKLRAPNTTPGA